MPSTPDPTAVPIAAVPPASRPAEIPGPFPPSGGILRSTLDRMAVLTVGLIAGFAVGLSFGGSDVRPTPGVITLPPVGAVGAADRPVPTAEVTSGRSGANSSTPSGAGGVDPRVSDRVAERGGRVRIGVFGDSFGVGIWDGLYRQLPREESFDVLRFGKEATGFTRYNAVNLEDRAREQLNKEPVDVAVISFGANDAIPFYADGHLQPFMSAGWQQTVGQRIDRFVAVARSTGARVYWVGLPAMRDPVLDANIREMNALYAAHMKRLGVPFIDTRPLSVDAQGRYAAHLPDAKGVPRLMRTPDGLHMIGIGYQRITEGLVARIRADAEHARAGVVPVERKP